MSQAQRITLARGSVSALWGITKAVFSKYQRDNAHILVSSISFYVLLTYIPFTLLSISILGYVIDMSNADMHLTRYLRNIMPEPYLDMLVDRALRETGAISLSKGFSGPLGIIFLFFFTTRIFGVIRPAFRIIFGQDPEKFIKGKSKELFLTFIFSIIQAVVFFSFVFGVLIQVKIVSLVPDFFTRTPVALLFSVLDMFLAFVMLYLLYYFLTPSRKTKKILFVCSLFGTVLWHIGKYLFKYYILNVRGLTAFFGTYGLFIAFLFWVYFSVFVFVACAELQSVLADITPRKKARRTSARK
jgi:membrane protein